MSSSQTPRRNSMKIGTIKLNMKDLEREKWGTSPHENYGVFRHHQNGRRSSFGTSSSTASSPKNSEKYRRNSRPMSARSGTSSVKSPKGNGVDSPGSPHSTKNDILSTVSTSVKSTTSSKNSTASVVNYGSKAPTDNDIINVLMDKIDSNSLSDRATYNRLKRYHNDVSFSYPTFVKALVRHFNLFQKPVGRARDSIQHYQREQLDILKLLVEEADSENNGRIDYVNFLTFKRILARSTQGASYRTLTRYAAVMNIDQDVFDEQRKTIKSKRTNPSKNPYGGAEQIQADVSARVSTFNGKAQAIGEKLAALSYRSKGRRMVRFTDFARVMASFDKYLSETDIESLARTVAYAPNDNKKYPRRNDVNLDLFMKKFSVDILKRKANRNSYETDGLIKWPLNDKAKRRPSTSQPGSPKRPKSAVKRPNTGRPTRSSLLRSNVQRAYANSQKANHPGFSEWENVGLTPQQHISQLVNKHSSRRLSKRPNSSRSNRPRSAYGQ